MWREKSAGGGEGALQVVEVFDQWDLCFDRCGLASKDTFLTKKQSENERCMKEASAGRKGWTLLTKVERETGPLLTKLHLFIMDMFIELLNTISALLASYTPLALFPWWPLPLISILHATRINLEYRRALKLAGHVGQPHAWLQGLSSTLTLSLGGTTISALLVGSHPGWLVSNVMIPAYMLVYAAVNHAPYDIIYKSLEMTATVLNLYWL